MEIIYVNPGKETHCDIYKVLSAFMKIYYLSNILQVQNIAAFIHACNTNFCMLNLKNIFFEKNIFFKYIYIKVNTFLQRVILRIAKKSYIIRQTAKMMASAVNVYKCLHP